MYSEQETVICRSRQSGACYHGRPADEVYPDGVEDDRTWDGESVVCDPCYIAIGQPSVPSNSPEAYDFAARIEGGKGRP